MSPIAAKPKMNVSPEAALMRARPNDKNSSRNVKSDKGTAALDLSAKSTVKEKSSFNDKEDSSSSSPKQDDSQFSKVLEAKNTPSRSNDSSPVNKNLSDDSKIATKSEPQAVSESGVAQLSSKDSSELIIDPKSQSETAPVSKQAAMQVFLERMQGELGVEPEQILQAFAELDVSDLTAPPEQTLQKVIGQLKLPPAKAKAAEDMYAEMLALSATATMSEYLKSQNQTANLTALSPKQAAQKEMQKNIGAMSDSFFGKPEVKPQVDGLKKAQGVQAYGKVTDKDRMAILGAGTVGAGAAALSAQDAAAAQAGASVGAFELPEDMSSMSIEDQKSVLATMKQELAKLDAMAPQAAAPEAQASNVTSKSLGETVAQNPAAAAAAGGMTSMAVAGKSHSSHGGLDKDSDSNSKDQLAAQDQSMVIDPKNHQVDSKLNVKGQFAVETPKAGQGDAKNNIQDIISQAQFLAKKGGGEMKVKMSPEGMGDIHLKVIVEKGQVNVEMIASNSEAKKLLERGMDELKSSLISHKLHVDQIKVGGAGEASSQMMNQHHSDDGRQNQQKFLQDFQDQNSAFRREIFDIGPARRPGSQILDNAANAQFNASAKKRADNRRLDLVA